MELKICVVLLLGYAVLPLLAQDTVTISSFSVEQMPSTVRITLMLSSPVNVLSGCFFDKVTFLIADGTTTFTPRNPGSCNFTSSASSTLTGTMDVDDFINSLQFMLFTARSSSSIMIRGSSPVLLVPGVSVDPISSPLQPSVFTALTVPPALVAFDLDINTVLLHFNGLMSTSTFRPDLLMLSASSSSSASQIPLNSSSPALGTPTYAATLCVTLSPTIQAALQDNSICGSTSACFCNVSSGLITNYLSVPIQESSLVQVTIIRTSATAPSSPVFFQLSLTYSSCSAQHYMMEDEVYVLRPFESVSRIECFTNDHVNSSNIQPQIIRGPSSVGNLDVEIEDYIGYRWPLSTYLNFTGGMPSQLYGQYICRSATGHHVRNYVHDNNFVIELPDGANYQLPLFDMLTIPFLLGSYPRINLTQPSTIISLFDMRGANISTTFDRVNPFHVNIRFDMVPQSLNNGSYDIRVLNVRASIRIEVTGPAITLRPQVATIAPGQDEIVLQCLPNSDSFLLSWTSGSSAMSLSSDSTYRERVPPQSSEYTCSVRAEGNGVVLASATVVVRNVQGNLNVWRGAAPVENNSLIEDRSGSVSLECFETVETNLTWIILPDNGSLTLLTPGKTDIFTVVESGNQATLNVEGVFSGLIKCLSSNDTFNIRIVEGGGRNLQTCERETDSVWNVQWDETISGRRDFQHCPMTSGSPTRGFVLRQCHEDGVWNETVDISDCSTESFESLRDFTNTLIRLRRAYSSVQLNASVTQLVSELRNITKPRPTTFFPKDLDATNNILVGLLDLLMNEFLQATHVGLIDVLDNLLHENNTEGWQFLTEMNRGSQLFFNISDAFGRYLLQSLGSDQNEMTISRVNIIYSAIAAIPSQGIMFPQSLTSRGAQITLPPDVLDGSTGVVHVAMNNLNAILPRPSSPPGGGISRIIASSIVSSQVRVPSGYLTNFNSSQVVTLEFLTEATARAADPVCLSWDAPSGDWLDTGIETVPPIEQPEAGEFKVFSIRCSSNRLGAFGAAINVSTSSEFDLSIPVIIGCAFVIFSSTLSLFALLLSWIFDSMRRYSVVAFFIHLSFVFSVMCAFLAFLVGIREALDHMIGCAAVAGLLQYFFTAAFSWLLCEVLLILFFSAFSQHLGLFVLLLIIGWGLPAIPTAISLGVLHGEYGTSTHCWFFFDGQVSSEVVLGFIIPKLIIVGVTLLLIPVGCITNCKFSNKKVQPYTRAKVTCILWFIWTSILLFLIFLTLSWVFAVLLVNVYGLDSDISGWIFMAASILLSLWMFIFSATLMVTNQKVDYERLWSLSDPSEPPTDPANREKGYQFMEMPNVDLTGKRTSTLTRSPPSIISDPGFGLHHTDTLKRY